MGVSLRLGYNTLGGLSGEPSSSVETVTVCESIAGSGSATGCSGSNSGSGSTGSGIVGFDDDDAESDATVADEVEATAMISAGIMSVLLLLPPLISVGLLVKLASRSSIEMAGTDMTLGDNAATITGDTG